MEDCGAQHLLNDPTPLKSPPPPNWNTKNAKTTFDNFVKKFIQRFNKDAG